MTEESEDTLVVGLDIGSSKVVAVIAELDNKNNIHIRGMGVQPSRGMKKGVITNIESTVSAIGNAISYLEEASQCKVYSLSASISGSHISGLNSHGMTPIALREVSEIDKKNVLENAGTVAIPSDKTVVHVLPQDYMIDGQGGISDPLGMSGVRLEARVHVVTSAMNAVQNLEKCVESCNLKIDKLVFQPLAVGYSVLSLDEKNLGVCVIDIGSGTTDVAIYINNAVYYTYVLPIAGDMVTNDIAFVQRISTQLAESIKVEYGCCLLDQVGIDELIKVPTMAHQDKTITRQSIVQVIESRYEEIFQLVKEEIRKSGYEHLLGSGIVLTGGGALIEGAAELATDIFEMPVRIGYPKNIVGYEDLICDPKFANVVGLLLAQKEHNILQQKSQKSVPKASLFSNIRRVLTRYF